MTLKIRVSSNPNGDGDLRKSVDGGSDFDLLTRADLLTTDPTNTGNVGTGEDVLKTYSLAANALAELNGLKVSLHGTWANNVNEKALRIYFGATEILQVDLGVSKPGEFILEMTVYRVNASQQRCVAEFRGLDVTDPSGPVAANFMGFVDTTEDPTAAIVIKATGEAVTTDDIVVGSFRIEPF